MIRYEPSPVCYPSPSSSSDVEHGILQRRMNRHSFRTCPIPRYALRWSAQRRRCVKKLREVTSSPLAHHVRIVSRRADADGFGGATEKIAHVVRQILEHVGHVLKRRFHVALGKDFVEHDVVVSGPRGALERGVRLQEEIPVAGLGNSAVDYSAVSSIGGVVGATDSRRIETGVVALADDDNGDFRETIFRIRRWI